MLNLLVDRKLTRRSATAFILLLSGCSKDNKIIEIGLHNHFWDYFTNYFTN